MHSIFQHQVLRYERLMCIVITRSATRSLGLWGMHVHAHANPVCVVCQGPCAAHTNDMAPLVCCAGPRQGAPMPSGKRQKLPKPAMPAHSVSPHTCRYISMVSGRPGHMIYP